MNIQRQCAKLDTLRHDLNRLLQTTYNVAARLSEHPDCESKLGMFLATFNASLDAKSKQLAEAAKEILPLVGEEVTHDVTWEPHAYADALTTARALDFAPNHSDELSHIPQPDQETQRA